MAGCYKDDDYIPFKFSSIEKIGGFWSGGAEIVAYENAKIYLSNNHQKSVDVLSLNSNGSLELAQSIDISAYGDSIQSVDIKNNLIAAAVGVNDKEDSSKHLEGKVVLFNGDGSFNSAYTVGHLPDMLTFSKEGDKIFVANEGEPNGRYDYDPKGSVSIIDLQNHNTTTVDFSGVDIPEDVRIKPDTAPELDLEPEFITVVGDKAYVTLQENNAIGVIDIPNKKVEKLLALGYKEHFAVTNKIDIEEDGLIRFGNYKNLYGMYQPDTIDSFEIGGVSYLVTANEGDGREYTYEENGTEYTSYTDEAKIEKLQLDTVIRDTYANDNDLKVATDLGDTNKDGYYEFLYAFGARSFSIWREDGQLIWDSADLLAELTASFEPEFFNQDGGVMDGRSGNKGVEPEALVVGQIQDQFYAFVGLERQNAIVVFNITDPFAPVFQQYLITHKDGDLSPEGMTFVKAEDSPTNNALLIVAFEESGTTAIYEVK